MSGALNIGIVGAGVIGLACARALQREGHRVTLLDPAPATDRSAAWGSAGILTPDSIGPLSTPETCTALPGMLLQPDAPLALRWRHAPRAVPWLVRFLWNARTGRVEHNTSALATLCEHALAAWRDLLDEGDRTNLLRPGGRVAVFESRRALEAGRIGIERRLRHGVEGEWLDGPALRDKVPQLAGNLAGGIWFPEAECCVDPGALLEALAVRVDADGGVFRRSRVTALERVEEGVGVRMGRQVERFDRLLICAGAHSRRLARDLGEDFPLEAERGYHVMLQGREGPSLPVISGEHSFVTTPMAGGTRLAGLSELAGLSRPPDSRRFALLRRRAAGLFPGLDTTGGSEWTGLRPTLPDSLPVIGQSRRVPRIVYALGHQHLGLTLAAVTASMIADELAGRTPVVDPHPFRVDRF